MSILNLITNCFGSTNPNAIPTATSVKANTPYSVRCAQQISDEVVELLLNAEKDGPALRRQIKDAVGEDGWTESIARAIVGGLEVVIRDGRDRIRPVLGEFIDKAEEAANTVFAFPQEHPYLTAGFATIVAVGVLVLVAPWVVEALGFVEAGPVGGSFAAWWESTYAGFIPKGSLFSFFQRLGMIWGRS
ncbi:hypothetical protein PspLS_11884 [Pyricularia sp. CBS 133598]|nr:hypothetical protein PspLS_11884 [Pyricularia sp. CBS 133598]